MRGMLVVLAAAAALAAAGASPAASPKVLRVVTTGFSVELDPSTVGLARYTIQFHNVGARPVRVRVGGTVSVLVPRNGWRFREIRFTRRGSYRVVAAAGPGMSWTATVTAQ